MPDNLERLKDLYTLINKDYTTFSDVGRLLRRLLAAIRSVVGDLEKRVDGGIVKAERAAESAKASVAKAIAPLKTDIVQIKGDAQRIRSTADEALTVARDARRDFENIEMPEPTDLGPLESRLGEVDARTNSAEFLRDLLEALNDDDRLDASAIKNLPEGVQKIIERTVAAHTALYTMSDVDFAGIVAGQSSQWDGIKWIPYTPAGSGGTPVFGEDLTPQGPGTAFTLAHSPISGSVRLFRGGAYQSVANGDYSILDDDITLASALQSGEVLVADYSY